MEKANGVKVQYVRCSCYSTDGCDCEPEYVAHADHHYGRNKTELEACYRLAKLDGLVWFQDGKIPKD